MSTNAHFSVGVSLMAQDAHQEQHVRKIEPEQISYCCREDVGSVGDWVVSFGAGEGHEFGGLLLFTECAAWVRVLLHYLAVPKALFSVSGEAFPCVLEERELGVQLALDEDSLTTIDLRGG